MNTVLLLGIFGLFGVGLTAPGPQNWPYQGDVSQYYYGYPGQTPYVYKASLEDDEVDQRYRQDSGISVSSLIHDAAAKQQEQVNNYGRVTDRPTVIETGSLAPVHDGPGESSPQSRPKVAPSPKVVKPGLVNPPAFPPARKPAPPAAKPAPTDEDEDEEDDDDEESAEDDEDSVEDEEEEDEERRRNEPLEIVTSTQVPENVTSLESIELPQGVNASQPVKPVVLEATNEVSPVAPDSSEPEEDTSDENSSVEGVEALVPGYVTDQGEVLVPVDTVTGDQPISIVPDPYSPPSRGFPLNYYGYNTGNEGLPVVPRYRQEADEEDEGEPEDEENQEADEDEVEEDEEDDDVVEEKPKPNKKIPLGLIPARAPTNEDDELENAFRRRSESFPPSRSPYLYPVTFRFNGGYLTGPFDRPVTSSEVFDQAQVEPIMRTQPVERRRPAVVPPSRRRPVPVTPYGYGEPNNDLYYTYSQQPRPQAQQVFRRRPAAPLGVSVSIPHPFYQPQQFGGNRRNSQSPRPFMQGQPQGLSAFAYPSPYGYGTSPPQFYQQRPGALHNPGEKLKIKSSYELLVEPHTQVKRVRTKTRPNNKKRVVQKKKTQSVKRRPVAVFARPPPQRISPSSQVNSQAAPVFYQPLYNVQPHQRVPAQGGQGFRQPPNLSAAFQEYREFVKGLAAGYYGNGNRPSAHNRRPTPVIQQDQVPASVDSSEASKEERAPKSNAPPKRRNNKAKKLPPRDPLNILTKINKSNKKMN